MKLDLRNLRQEIGYQYISIYLTITSFGDHLRLRDLPAQLNVCLLSEAIRGFIWFSLSGLEIWKSTTPMDAVPEKGLSHTWCILVKSPEPQVTV